VRRSRGARAFGHDPKTKVTAPLDIIKPAVRALRAYTLAPYHASVKINQNENPWDAPNEIKEEVLRRFAAREWSRYPDFVPASLHEKLAQFANWKPDGVIAGNGSNELIQAVLMVAVGPGKRVLISEPTFALYKQVATVLGGDVETVLLTPQLTYDTDALLGSIEEKQPDVTIICSPNNPTGCLIEAADLDRLLRATPGLIVIDEAYHEFAQQSVVPLLAEHENLIVLRTFSKAMAFAALRVGYLLAAPELVREIRKAVLPYNLNAFSQLAAEVAIEKYPALLGPTVEAIIAERERLYTTISQLRGLQPVKSEANFMLVRADRDPRQIFAELLKRDILVRDVSGYPLLGDYFRFSVGTPEENDRLLRALHEIQG
jgi:histidinol-phosphate aminotransferase